MCCRWMAAGPHAAEVLMSATEQLLAFEEIRAVKARYCRFLDTKDWESLAELFTIDAVLDVRQDTGQEPFIARDLLIEHTRRGVIHAKSAHQVHTPEISFLRPDEATV